MALDDAAARPQVTAVPQLSGGGLPWLGPCWSFRRDPVALLRAGRERLGNVFGFPLLGRRVVFACGPEAHAAVFGAEETVLSPKEAYRFVTPVFGPGVAYDAAPQEMSAQIGHLLPALSPRRLDGYARIAEEEVRTRLAHWAPQGEVDLLSELNRMTAAIATRCLIGDEFQHGMGPHLPGLYRDLESGIRLAGILSPALPLPSFRRRDRARAAIARAIGDVIAARRATSAGASDGCEGKPAAGVVDVGGGDMLATLLAARTPDGSALSDDLLTGILIGMIFAGQHTSAVLATWTGALLLQHPEYLGALLAEQRAVTDGTPRLGAEPLRRMELLERCVREAERLHPPLILFMRKALQEVELVGHTVPAGALVMLSPAVAHRMPEIFRDPDRFDPARYEAPREEHRQPHALIGFGGGRHRCVGSAFAYLQVKAVWSVLLREVAFDAGHADFRPDYSTFIPGPVSPRVRYRKRSVPVPEQP
ncbi:cytochrome P450 [Streptomyces longispororuber]|uniref:cytochrome P450 n=1 Tax=Streptomyces longispororuber TaxID=68230 RepID=UPI0033E391F6